MPRILDRLHSQLVAKGMPDARAWAVATEQLQRRGVLKSGTQELTDYGKVRNSMTAGQRAIDRAVKASGGKHAHTDFVYSRKTNRATLKGSK